VHTTDGASEGYSFQGTVKIPLVSGKLYTPDDLIQNVTGKDMSA